MTSLEIALLGGFRVRLAGQAIDVPGRKERALLAVLAMPAGEPRSRDKLAGLLWSERGDKQARDSLKQPCSSCGSRWMACTHHRCWPTASG